MRFANGSLIVAAEDQAKNETGRRLPDRVISSTMIIYDVDSTQPVVNPVYLREPPWKILLADAYLVFQKAGLLPVVLSPLPVVGVDITWIGLLGQIALTAGSIGVSAVCLSSLLGFPAPLLAVAVFYGFICLSNWIQGVNVLQSQGRADAGNEAWLL